MAKKERPLGITILAIFQIIAAILSLMIVIAIPIYLQNYNLSYLLENEIFKLIFIYYIIMIPISIILAIGLLKRVMLAWVFIIILQAINFFTSIYRYNIFGIFVSIVIIIYLTRPHIKEYYLLD